MGWVGEEENRVQQSKSKVRSSVLSFPSLTASLFPPSVIPPGHRPTPGPLSNTSLNPRKGRRRFKTRHRREGLFAAAPTSIVKLGNHISAPAYLFRIDHVTGDTHTRSTSVTLRNCLKLSATPPTCRTRHFHAARCRGTWRSTVETCIVAYAACLDQPFGNSGGASEVMGSLGLSVPAKAEERVL